MTFRPEFNAPWVGQSQVTSLTLNRLGKREAAAIVTRIFANKELPADMLAEIVERTDGIPLFIEETTKAVLEAESEGAARRTVAAVPSSALAVPASLYASLMARLDRLGPAREAAQIGSAIGREFSHALLAAVALKPEAELESTLDRLVAAGLLFRQGVPPHASYLFKHALVQDAAYGTLLREPRRALHARIAEALESQFAEIAERQPELLARHCTEAGLIEKAAGLWGKAGQRSLERSALVEAADQLTRALAQIATLPATPALRRDEIKLQVAHINTLFNFKGYAAAETKAAVERARLLIEQAEALGEPPEDPLLLFSVLYGFWVANYVAFNGDVMRELAAQFLSLAETQGATVPRMIGHRILGVALMYAGDIVESRPHFDRAIALYDPAQHRPLAARFGADVAVTVLTHRPLALWVLGYPEAALADVEHALDDAREIPHAATLMHALFFTAWTHSHCGNHSIAKAQLDELVALADEKSSLFWKTLGMLTQRCALALTGETTDSAHMITSGIKAFRSTGGTLWAPSWVSYLARAYADIGQFDDAWRCIAEATNTVQTTKEKWCEAEVHRTAGEIALKSPHRIWPWRKPISSTRWRLLVSSARSPGSCGRRRAWRAFGALKVRGSKLETFSPRFTAGSPRVSTRSTSESQRGCSTTWLHDRACSRPVCANSRLSLAAWRTGHMNRHEARESGLRVKAYVDPSHSLRCPREAIVSRFTQCCVRANIPVA